MKLRNTLLSLLFILLCGFISGQRTYKLSFQLNELPDEKLWLVFYYGDQQFRQDSGMTDQAGRIAFLLNENDDIGMYRLEQDKQKGLDFIFNKEDVSIIADRNMGLDNLVVKESKENELFFDYYRHKLDMETRIDVLHGFLKYYPPVDTFYTRAEAYAAYLSSVYKVYLDSLQSNFPDKLVPRIIRLDQLPDLRPGELDPATAAQYRAGYFSGIDLTDSLILNTPLLPAKVIDYLSLFISPGASRADQEKNFIQAVDSLMKFTGGGPKVREMVVNYLINGFQSYGFETVVTYIVENYVIGQSCVSDQQEEKLRIRIEGFKKLAIGSTVPPFEIIDSEGKPVSLTDTQGRPTLLIFWAGDCPHCEAILPELKTLYSQFGDKVRFIGISVDQDENTWRNALKKNELPWANIAELKGWEGKIIQDYYVYATPTFLLVDSNLKIKAKPIGFAELKGELMK
jgi:thiol-disulfide isomerase/thioredoxin